MSLLGGKWRAEILAGQECLDDNKMLINDLIILVYRITTARRDALSEY